jgi:hypothetical protein
VLKNCAERLEKSNVHSCIKNGYCQNSKTGPLFVSTNGSPSELGRSRP